MSAADSSAPAAAPAASALSRAVGPIRQPKASFRLSLPAWSSAPVPPFDQCHAEVYDVPGVILDRQWLKGERGHSFGRHAEWCNHVLPKISSISRQHAAVVHTRTGPVILDLFSQHGTTLNGTKLTPGQAYALYEGDVARFGGAGSFFKFKGTGRPKREADAAVTPIVPPADYSYESVDERGNVIAGDASAAGSSAAAGASTAAVAAPSASTGAVASSSTGDKRKREGDASSRKDARGEGGARHPRERGSGGAETSSSSSASGLADPRRDRVRCRHLLVKHAGSRRPSSWRCESITLSLADARSKLERLRGELIAGNPSASELEARLMRMAAVESDCSSAKMQGDLGFFAFGKMQPAFSKASFQLAKGQLSDLVETDSGVHIIMRIE